MGDGPDVVLLDDLRPLGVVVDLPGHDNDDDDVLLATSVLTSSSRTPSWQPQSLGLFVLFRVSRGPDLTPQIPGNSPAHTTAKVLTVSLSSCRDFFKISSSFWV